MIERVLLAGEDVDPYQVLASVTIRHGRGSVDDGPLASTANVTLLELSREQVIAFAAGDELELLLAGDEPRFRGRISDMKLRDDGSLELVATSSLARIMAREVGVGAWPQESWRARIARVFVEADASRAWADVPSSFAWEDAAGIASWNVSPTSTVGWLDFGLLGHVRFEWAVAPGSIGAEDEGPTIAARAGSATTLGAYLSGDFGASEPFALAGVPDGSILLQRLAYRATPARLNVPGTELEIPLDPETVAYAPEFEQADTVENELELSYAGGTVTAANAASQERFERRAVRISTELVNAPDAAEAATLRVHRRGFPRWQSSPIELLELRDELRIGDPLRLTELPEWGPATGLLGILEGWEDKQEADGAGGFTWSQRLYVSDPRLSGGFLIRWAHTAETYLNAIAWNEAVGLAWDDPEPLLELLED